MFHDYSQEPPPPAGNALHLLAAKGGASYIVVLKLCFSFQITVGNLPECIRLFVLYTHILWN